MNPMDRRRFLAASLGAGAALMGAQLKAAPGPGPKISQPWCPA
jgi:hypothetical protein